MTPAATFAEFLETARGDVDAALNRQLPAPPACPAIVAEAMRYSVFAGGKRLRPLLTLAAADAARGDQAPASVRTLALPAACAVELIHTYSLIHDDLPAMDNDTLRRGRPTLHVVYGDGIAILAGDGLQAEAFTLLAREPDTDEPAVAARKLRVLGVIGVAAGAAGMVGGQALDLQAAGQTTLPRLPLDGDALRGLHARKTGALITAAAASGTIMAGGGADVLSAVTRYAADLGVAFQIIDDVLDVEGNAATLGKTAGKDAASEKPTYPALFGVERSRALAADCVESARAALEQGHLTESFLWPIAEWMLGRRH